MDLIVSLGLIGVLIAVIYFDLRHMRIPNLLSLILAVLFFGLAVSHPTFEIGFRIAQSTVVFMMCFVAFMFRLIGGGDVKILAALALFVPLANASSILMVFSGTLLSGTALIMLSRRAVSEVQSNWAFLGSTKLPMGVPIGIAGLIVVVWSMVIGNH